jgi:hypothetical protein
MRVLPPDKGERFLSGMHSGKPVYGALTHLNFRTEVRLRRICFEHFDPHSIATASMLAVLRELEDLQDSGGQAAPALGLFVVWELGIPRKTAVLAAAFDSIARKREMASSTGRDSGITGL